MSPSSTVPLLQRAIFQGVEHHVCTHLRGDSPPHDHPGEAFGDERGIREARAHVAR
jgi:hypothetical protein